MSFTKQTEIFALVDCNSFYCSCERVFNPKLKNHPVVVLSNNDGCIISLTKEAKAVGIKMGGPIHHQKELIKKYNVAVFSSNYTLYGDMSARVMQVLREFSSEMEVYSIDEAFLSLRRTSGESLTDFGQLLRETVRQCTGIPVSVGIGKTKVLAKAANRIAKKNEFGVFDLCDENIQESVLEKFPVADIWGIGARSIVKLEALGIKSAKDLRDAPVDVVRKYLTVVGRRIQDELSGVSCLGLELETKDKKQIISSRSFGKLLSDIEPIEEAVASHVTRAAEKLRKQDLICQHLIVFLHTNPFRDQDTQYYNQAVRTFSSGSSYTPQMIAAALSGLKEIYRSGLKFKKAGIILSDIRPRLDRQRSLFDLNNDEETELMMGTLDRINKKFGTEILKFASCGTDKHWQMRSEALSPRYTTSWEELLRVS